jgi:murein L,D-transpeptidase YcbB/YkuD
MMRYERDEQHDGAAPDDDIRVSASHVSRRLLITGSAAALAATWGGSASAQMPAWLENLGFSPGNGYRPRPATREPERLDDLRPDAVPWRSDEMLTRMERAIAHYQKIVERGGWPEIPPGRLLRLDDDDPRVSRIKRRLGMSGELRAGPEYYASSRFDEHLERAVRDFQQQFGLRVTGRVDRPTMAQLAAPARARLEQLKLNYRRIRELMQERIEDRYVLVNAAAYQLEAIEGHEVRLRHRVIVGKPDRQTPSVKATIRALNFFPFWHVPESVAHLDLIPRLRKEPDYLEKERIRVYGLQANELDRRIIDWNQVDHTKVRFKQDPGPWNALGLVRIDMPNKEIVYMHDTPMKPLFGQRVRPFSAGCVRVQDVFKLVEWIARHEVGWEEPGRAQQVIDQGQPLDITLTRPVPVYFTYITAWAEEGGRAVFRPDVYGRDGVRDLVGEGDPEDRPTGRITLAP